MVVGLAAVSTSGPFILLAGIGPFAFAAWRLMSVALLILPLALPAMIRDFRKLTDRERFGLLAAGVLYGAHFALFTLAFEHTSKESVVVLLAAQPLMAAAVGHYWLDERVTRVMIVSSLIGVAGLSLFVWHDYAFDAGNLLGDAISILCGLAIVISYSMGRTLRPRMSLIGYLGWLYLIGGLTCLITALATADPLWGYSGASWYYLICAILIPTMVGHSLFHYVVKYVPIFYVNMTILGEPVITITIMILLSHRFEVFRRTQLEPLQIAGGLILLVGVGIGLTVARSQLKLEKSA